MILAFILLEYLFCASSIVVKEEKEKEIHMFFLVFRGPKSDNENMFCMDECLCDKCFVHVISVKCMICSSSGFIWKKNSLWAPFKNFSFNKKSITPSIKGKIHFWRKSTIFMKRKPFEKKILSSNFGTSSYF